MTDTTHDPLVNNVVLHNTHGSSDKLYIIGVSFSDGAYRVVTRWGKRSSRTLMMKVIAQVPTFDGAFDILREQTSNKLKRNYSNILDPDYYNPKGGVVRFSTPIVARSMEFLRLDAPASLAPEPNPNPTVIEDVLVICRSNTGMPDAFNEGVEYVADRIDQASGLAWVFDNFGKLTECYADRFEVVGS